MDLHERYIRAGSTSATPDELTLLSEDPEHRVRLRAAENPNTPAHVLAKLADDAHHDVRIAVGENHMAPPEVLEALAADAHLDVRFALAENPHLPPALLAKLADDDNPYISHRAKHTIRRKNPPEVTEFKSHGPGQDYGRDSYTMRDIRYR